MENKYDVVVAGHICLDIIPNLSNFPHVDFSSVFRPGSLLSIGPATLALGGPVANTGLAMHILGMKTRLMGKVGADLFGDSIFQIIRSYNPSLAEEMIIQPGVPTSYTIVINPPDIDRFLMHCPGANDMFGVDDVNYEQLTSARLFHFGYPPIMKLMYADDGGNLSEVFRRAKTQGVTTSLDMALPDPNSASGKANWMRILEMTLPYVDIFLPSIEELLYMVKRQTYTSLLEASSDGDILPLITPDLLNELSSLLLDFGVKIVVIKLGYRGLYLRAGRREVLNRMGRACVPNVDMWEDREFWAPVFKTKVVGTTGAGDSTIAGFLSAVLNGFTAEQAIVAATAVGACNVEASDSLSGLRSWEDTMARIPDWPRQALDLSKEGWRPRFKSQIWGNP